MREKPQTKRQLVDDARRAALEGRWTEAIELNQQLIERSPKDAEAHNRLGRALVELRRYGPAIEAYSNALRSDPANMIARRNLQRLDLLRHRPQPEGAEEDGGNGAGATAPRTAVFIEEIGKTWVDELVNPSPMEDLVGVTSGQQLQLEVANGRLYVADEEGKRLGEIEAKTAERVISLIEGGNRYEVYALGITTQSLRVILREVYHDPSHGTRLSFPRQIKSRAYLRERDLLRQRDEADFFMLDDEDEDEDEEEEPTAEAADDEDAAEPDAEPFIDETVTVEEEEQSI
jgi:hypothetical protein